MSEVEALHGGYMLAIALGKPELDGKYTTEQIYMGAEGLLHIVARRMPNADISAFSGMSDIKPATARNAPE